MPRRNPIHLGTPKIEHSYKDVESTNSHPGMELVVTYCYPIIVDLPVLPALRKDHPAKPTLKAKKVAVPKANTKKVPVLPEAEGGEGINGAKD